MNFDKYQELAHRTAGPDTCLQMAALGLAGESGEVADIVKKITYHGHELSVTKMIDELGDVLWYISEMCSVLDISLDEVAGRNIEKLQRRYPDGFSSERSINRDTTVTNDMCMDCGAITGRLHYDACTRKENTSCPGCGVKEGMKHDTSCHLMLARIERSMLLERKGNKS